MSEVLLIFALAIILISAELFTNGVEWFGRRYELGEGAVGSILAAVGTALPETLIPVIAILFTGTAASDDIGIGAILGAPFMLASIAMVVTSVAVVVFHWRKRRSLQVTVNESIMRRDLSHFLIAYGLAMVVSVFHVRALHYALAAGLLLFYVYYVWETLKAEGDLDEETRPLYFHRHLVMPHTYRIYLQIGAALVGIVVGAELFVHEVEALSEALGAAPLVVSLLITPIATELPEKFNSVIWIRQRKDTLALGNITGAMVFQSTFPVSIGLVFTSWQLTGDALAAGLLALVSGAVFYVTLRVRHTLTWWSLGGAGSVYVAYLVYVFGFAH
jgi:cation:H+ antiporter